MIQGWNGQEKKSQRLEQYIEKDEGDWNQQLKGWVNDWSSALDKSLEICYNLEEDAHNAMKSSTSTQLVHKRFELITYLFDLFGKEFYLQLLD